MKNQLILVFIILGTFLCCESRFYSNKSAKENPCVNIKEIQSLLKKDIYSINEDFFKCFTLKDTILDSDDGVKWKGKVFYNKNNICLIAETNWQNPNIISQISILCDQLEIRKNVSVGKKFKDIYPFLSTSIPSMPDGYLALKDRENNKVTYFMNINEYPNLSQGVDSLQQIPNDLKVQIILIK